MRIPIKGARGQREEDKSKDLEDTSGTILFRIAKEKTMGFDTTNMPGREALYLQARANDDANPALGDIGPRPPDPTDPQ